MDIFTQTALARSRATSPVELPGTAAPVEEEKGPITVEERLAFAYPDGVPRTVARMLINWDLPYGRDSYHTHEARMAIYRDFESRAVAANKRGAESRDRLAELESRLATLRVEYAGLRAQFAAPTPLHLTPREAGLMEVDRAGYEKLISATEAEIERLRPEPARLRREHENFQALAYLTGVIIGHLSKTDSGARYFGFEFAWQLSSPAVRKEREAAYREEQERRREQSERNRLAAERMKAEREERERERLAAEARFESLGVEALISNLFFKGEELTLAQIKGRVTGWDELRTFKEVVRLWPGVDDPDLLIAAQRDVSDWIKRRRDDPAWRPTAEEDLINRTARRLAELLRPGHLGAAVALNEAAPGLHKTEEPTLVEITRMDFDGLLGFIFAGKPNALDGMLTLKAVIAARPDSCASNTVQAAINELLPIGATESSLYNYALRRLATLITSQEENQSL